MTETKKANVLFVAHDTGLIGGAERQLLELFKGMDRSLYGPYLVCLEEGGPVAEGAEDLDVPVYHMPRKWRWDLSVISRLRSLIRRNSISIVHAYLGLPGFYGASAGRLSGTKVISTIRIAGPRRHISDVSERLAFLISHRIISNSQAGLEYYFKRFPGRHKTLVIYNGYNLAEFDLATRRSRSDLGLPEQGKIIGHVANLTYLKDYPTFIRALPTVFAEEPEAIAVIAGDGPKRAAYEGIAGSLGIQDRTLFLGHRRDVLDLVRNFDICVLASHPDYSEGLSNSIAEYMGLAKAVVATAIGGNVELVEEGVTGLLSPPGKPEPLAEKMITLLANADLRAEMGKRGRQFFEANLTLGKMVAKTQQVYSDLLKG
jgi:glycosyltransferase involved in cell wall biosynthesis